jgi:hypothetical protein
VRKRALNVLLAFAFFALKYTELRIVRIVYRRNILFTVYVKYYYYTTAAAFKRLSILNILKYFVEYNLKVPKRYREVLGSQNWSGQKQMKGHKKVTKYSLD